jgi:hypothetical protein
MPNRQHASEEKQNSVRQRQQEPQGPMAAQEGMAPQQAGGLPPLPGTQRLRQAAVLRMQRNQGNASVQRALLQRQDQEPGAPAEVSGPGGHVSANGGGLELSSNGPLTISAPMVQLNSAFVQSSGVLQTDTLVATSVVASSYTPGAGNMW